MKSLILCVAGIAVLVIISLAGAPAANANTSGCYAHRPRYVEGVFEVRYDAGCTGHDEPELDPVSSVAGPARELTWKGVLPSDGSSPVSATGPAFWFGGTVTDPKRLFAQASVQLQVYPHALVSRCG